MYRFFSLHVLVDCCRCDTGLNQPSSSVTSLLLMTLPSWLCLAEECGPFLSHGHFLFSQASGDKHLQADSKHLTFINNSTSSCSSGRLYIQSTGHCSKMDTCPSIRPGFCLLVTASTCLPLLLVSVFSLSASEKISRLCMSAHTE